MSHCKACDVPITYQYIKDEYTEVLDHKEVEYVCSRCKAAAYVNMPEDWYETLWWDKHGHPSHIVIRPAEDYLL